MKFHRVRKVFRKLTALRTATLLTTVALGLLATGCAQDVGLIDRVQANYTKKQDLAGVWYEMGVVTDMPSSAGFGFVGQQHFGGKDGKVIFDLQEKSLIVYPYAETVLGGDAKWNKKKIRKFWDPALRNAAHGKAVKDEDFVEVVVGNPTAIYPITSHFDIKRNYSPATGAQDNVKVENTTDRPWWQREYVRVDWLGNTLTSFEFPQGATKYSPVDYYVPQDEVGNPNRFYMDPDGGYFHFTRRLFGQPMSTGACSPYNLAPEDCAGAAFDVRISYKRANSRHINDYETLPYPNGGAQDRFGFFLAERYRFDEDYGLTYTGHDYKAARWNIWQHSKDFQLPVDAKGKPVQTVCLSNHDCTAPQVCDQDEFLTPGVCKVGARIDYSRRKIRPIIYHLSADQPADHVPAEYETADAWSDVFKETVSWLRFWESKWSTDIPGDHVGFTDPRARFGQRYCQSHDDCSQHAIAQVTLQTHGQTANRLVIATAAVGGKAETVVVEDCLVGTDSVTNKQVCTDRPKLAPGDGYVAFVNASPGVAKATLSGLPTPIADVPYKAFDPKDSAKSVVAAKDHAVVVPKASAGNPVTLTADVGGKTVTLPNVHLDDALVVILIGGDRLITVHTKGVKAGLRLVNAIATASSEGLSSGTEVATGVNGMRVPANLGYAKVSDYAYFTGNNPHAAFLRPDSRGDVACIEDNGVGICTGWRQTLTEQDTKTRAEIKANLQDVFVICENQFTRDKKTCDAAGQTGKHDVLNDCRYWVQVDGKDFNPCADVKDQGLVPHAAEPKIGGDSRYNYMYWVTNVEPTSPLGYGPAAPDPDTGEIVWATANVYGASLVTYAQYAKDLVDLLNGDLSEADLASGKYIKDYVQAQSQSAKDKSQFGALVGGPQTPETSAAQAQGEARVRMIDLAPAAGAVHMTAQDAKLASDMQDPKALKAWMDTSMPTFDMNQVLARLDKVKGTPLERAMINDEVALVMSEGQVQPGDEISPEMLGKISPTGWATPRKQMDENRRMQLLGINNIELAEFQDPAIFGLAQRMKCQPGQTQLETAEWTQINDTSGKYCFKGDALRTALSVALFAATVEHEVGHTVGLRHNFEGSMDLLNYFDGYFDESTGREKEFVPCAALATTAGTIGADEFCEKETFGEHCVFKPCSKNADCAGGSACDVAKKQCVDQDGIQVGTCHGDVVKTSTCDTDAVCGDGSVCLAGVCGAKVSCASSKACLDGESCAAGFCVDQQTGKPRAVQTVGAVDEQLRKYVPRAGLTDAEKLHRRTEWQYSTVMDYGQKINSDIHSLGKYDYAAIKFGYGEMVEVYADTSYLSQRTHKYAETTKVSFEAVSWKMSTERWQYAGDVTPTFDIVNHWMPPEFNKKRETVPAFAVSLEYQNVAKYGRNDGDRTYFEVPYKYHSDEYRGAQGVYTFDTGASPEEIVYHAGEAMTEYYLLDAFKRERLWFGKGGSPSSYLARITDRWLTPMGNAGRYYAIYNNFYRVYPWFNYFEHTPFGMNVLRRASQDAFNRLAALITTPAPGAHVLDAVSNSYVSDSYEPKPGAVNIPIGQGKYPWTTFATSQGYYYYDHPKWIGGYWDKVAAISVLTNSSTAFLTNSLGEQLPLFRGTAIGFNTVYPQQLASLLGGLAAGDVQEIGGSFDKKSGTYTPRDFFRPVKSDAQRVQPSVLNHSLRLLGAWQAIANLPAGFDPEFTDSMALWLKGNGKQFDVGATTIGSNGVAVEQVQFEDPFGQKTYMAIKPNYDANRYSPTFRMLQRLNVLKTGCADGNACSDAGLCKAGEACAKTWYGKAIGAEKDLIGQAIKKEIEVIDYFRMLYGLYGDIGVN